jgi:TraK protein
MQIITRSLFLAAFSLLFCKISLALATQLVDPQPIEIKYLQQVHLDVASEAVNRINFDNFRVVKLIGNISSFASILSEHGSDLFITPKLPVGKKIDFSALLATGDIIDFSLKIVEGQTPYLVKLKFPMDVASTNKSEAVKMIEAMNSGRLSKYYVQKPLKEVNIPWISKIKATAQNTYRFGNLHGTILILENLSHSHSFEITASEFTKHFTDIAAIYIKQNLLPVKGKTKAYIVFKGLGA